MMLAATDIVLPSVLSAQQSGKAPLVVQKLLDCRAIADDGARLACFDAQVSALDSARAAGDVALVDREQVRRAKRGLFGFALRDLPLFGDRDDATEGNRDEVREIVSQIKSVDRNRDGGWILTLEDGARWEQTQAMTFGRNPRPGATATIRRASLGSYKMSVDGSPAVKARRIG